MPTEYLREVAIFKDLTDVELASVSDLWKFRTVEPHECIVAEGALMHEFFVICTGIVHVRRRSQDHEVLLARVGPGGFFGEMNLFDEANATASVYAMDEVRLAVASDSAFRDFMAANSEIGYKVTARLLAVVCGRLRRTNERLVHSMFWPSASPVSE